MSTKTSSDSNVAVEEQVQHVEPPMYSVVFYNDDWTPFEFVIHVLHQYFDHTVEQSIEIAQKIHNEGHGAAGIYPHEIAEMKCEQVKQLAHQHEYPFRCEIQEEGPSQKPRFGPR